MKRPELKIKRHHRKFSAKETEELAKDVPQLVVDCARARGRPDNSKGDGMLGRAELASQNKT